MIKTIIITLTSAVFLTAVSWYLLVGISGTEETENYTGGTNRNGELYPERCLNGVVYYNQGLFGLAIAGKTNGLFYQCNRKNRNG